MSVTLGPLLSETIDHLRSTISSEDYLFLRSLSSSEKRSLLERYSSEHGGQSQEQVPLGEFSEWVRFQASFLRHVDDYLEHEIVKLAYSRLDDSFLAQELLTRVLRGYEGSTQLALIGTLIKLSRQWLGLSSIIRQIRTRTAFDPLVRETSSVLEVRGRVDWHSTLRRQWQSAQTRPPTFELVVPYREFRTPENLLAVYALHSVRRDAEQISRHYAHLIPADSQYRSLLDGIRVGTYSLLASLPLLESEAEAQRLLRLHSSHPELLSLEKKVEKRLTRNRRFPQPYRDLLAWWRNYREVDYGYGEKVLPWAPRRISDELFRKYEFWVLLAVIRLLERYAGQGVLKTLKETQRVSFHEEMVSREAIYYTDFNGKKIVLEYQKEGMSWAYTRFVPDILMSVGSTKIILDAKLYFRSSEDEAVNKMLTYIGGFLRAPSRTSNTEPSVQHAVLFFPKAGADEEPFQTTVHEAEYTIRKIRLIPDPSCVETNKVAMGQLWPFILEA